MLKHGCDDKAINHNSFILLNKQLEFSKILCCYCSIVWTVLVIGLIALLVIFPFQGEFLINALNTITAAYAGIILAYLGKSGWENYSKIRQDLRRLQNDTNYQEEDSNAAG